MTAAPPVPAAAVPRLPGVITRSRLANGLELCFLRTRQAPIVTCALWYGAGTRDECPPEGGLAHYLEHMMFKGSPGYGPGEIDRRTQALGGSNNAFTSHDATAYYFNFARSCWSEALRIEADRMAALTLDADEVERERRVILEEISMYEDEPWDALEMAVQEKLFGSHAYGRPVLGTRESLAHCGRDELAAFHRRYYRPDNAVLVIAGDFPPDAREQVEKFFGGVPPGGRRRPPLTAPVPIPGWRRLSRRAGEVARLSVAVACPPADHPDHPALRLLVTLLTAGRASRLQRLLVEDRQLCIWVSGSLSESPVSSQLGISLELVPGASPQEVEDLLLLELERVGRKAPAEAEVARARRVLQADWVFGHERIHQRALTAGFAILEFDLGHPQRHLQQAVESRSEDLQRVAQRYFQPALGGVIGWSLPAGRGDEDDAR